MITNRTANDFGNFLMSTVPPTLPTLNTYYQPSLHRPPTYHPTHPTTLTTHPHFIGHLHYVPPYPPYHTNYSPSLHRPLHYVPPYPPYHTNYSPSLHRPPTLRTTLYTHPTTLTTHHHFIGHLCTTLPTLPH